MNKLIISSKLLVLIISLCYSFLGFTEPSDKKIEETLFYELRDKNLKKADQLFLDKKYQQAVDVYIKNFLTYKRHYDSQSPHIIYKIGLSHYHNQKYDSAEYAFERADLLRDYRVYFYVYKMVELTDKSKKIILSKDFFEDYGAVVSRLNYLGFNLKSTEMKIYKDALKLYPENKYFKYRLGLAIYKQDKNKKGLELLLSSFEGVNERLDKSLIKYTGRDISKHRYRLPE